MSKSTVAKITISLPRHLLEFVERQQQERGRTRSEVIRRALERVRREEDEREAVAQYIRSYQEQPETEEEFGWSDQLALEALADLPWEDEGEAGGGMVGDAAATVAAPAGPARGGG
jgi:Arc/MetJ-type ribon-helix-helix transcriptional regulator